MKSNNRLRQCAIAFCFGLGITMPFGYDLHQAVAQKVNPKELTRDLDKKQRSLAEEEEKLLASIDQQHAEERQLKQKKTSTSPVQVQKKAPANIDLKKVADAIVQADEEYTKPKVIKIPVAQPLPDTELQKASAEAAPMAALSVEKLEGKSVKETSQANLLLEEKVTTMGNLFSQWHKEFEAKHSELSGTQRRSGEELQARIESLEKRIGAATQESAKELLQIRQTLEKELQSEGSWLEKQKKFDETLSKHEMALDSRISEFEKNLTKSSTLVDEQLASLKALKLAEGQLRHRMTSTEHEVNDTKSEISGVRDSIMRIEANLSELSAQFVDSLKYRPLTVYEAPESWSDDFDYDWGQANPKYTNLPHNAVLNNMAIVTVTEETANLWSGPGEDDKIVTTLKRGGELAVEFVQDDWYRVILADGRRAWIPARSVIHNNPTGKNTTLRIASAQ